MSNGHLLCLGLGYSATAAAREMLAHGWHVSGTTRDAARARRIDETGIRAVLWDAPNRLPAEALSPAEGPPVTDILVSVSPGEAGDPALAGLQALTGASPSALSHVRSILYCSSTGVYGDHEGRWVTEESPVLPTSERGRRRLRAEHGWEDFAAANDCAEVNLRLAGIYGPGRNAIETLIAQRDGTGDANALGGQRIYKKGQVFSRIHQADIAGIIAALLTCPTEKWPETHALNLADDLPSPPHEVIEYAAYLLGIAPPPLIDLDTAQLSPMARSFYAENKRVANACVKQTLGYTFRYPSYREGLTAILRELK